MDAFHIISRRSVFRAAGPVKFGRGRYQLPCCKICFTDHPTSHFEELIALSIGLFFSVESLACLGETIRSWTPRSELSSIGKPFDMVLLTNVQRIMGAEVTAQTVAKSTEAKKDRETENKACRAGRLCTENLHEVAYH